jgi:hypothetical protein
VRCYKARGGGYVWLPDEEGEGQRASAARPDDATDYDVQHYVEALVTSYAGRLKKAFAPADFDQLFRADAQLGLFDTPVSEIGLVRIG